MKEDKHREQKHSELVRAQPSPPGGARRDISAGAIRQEAKQFAHSLRVSGRDWHLRCWQLQVSAPAALRRRDLPASQHALAETMEDGGLVAHS
jgi:hypothetical protein